MKSRFSAGILLLCALLNGCAGVKYKIADDVNGAGSQLSIVDRRDEKQKTSEIMSLLTGTCWYGIYRLGDDQLAPDRMSVLKNRLATLAGAQVAGRQIEVSRFEVFNNYNGGGGVTDAVLPTTWNQSHDCKQAYEIRTADNADLKPSVVVWIDVSIAGRKYAVRQSQLTPLGSKLTPFDADPLPERIRNAVSGAIDKLGTQIAAGM
jgi:hypothetical protein